MDTIITETTGERIKKRRKELGLSVEEIAPMLSKGPATLYRYERYDFDQIPDEVIDALAPILGVSVCYLMRFTTEPNCAPDNSTAAEYRKTWLSIERGTEQATRVYMQQHVKKIRLRTALKDVIDKLTDDDITSIISYIKFLAAEHAKEN